MATTIPYLFQNRDASYNSVAKANFQLGIFDIEDIRLTSTQMGNLHNQGKTLFSYVSIAEAAPYRPYWQENGWDTNPPGLLIAKNPNWNSYPVKYWEPEWQKIVIDQAEHIVKAGYDGMYMDVVDTYMLAVVENAYDGPTSVRQEMIDFVKTLSAHNKALNPDFKVIANNAQDLLTDTSYLKAIDGVGNEDLYYSIDNTRVTWTEGNLKLLQHAIDAGKLVLDIDYPTTDAAQQSFITMAIEDGIIPFIGNLSLNGTIDATNYNINDLLPADWIKLLDGPNLPINGTAQADTLRGTVANNKIHGLDGNDRMNGNGGNDTMQGGLGTDTLYGGVGNDRLYGDADIDLLYGEAGNDTLIGGGGNDSLRGGAGNDHLYGSQGNDRFIFYRGSAHDVIRDFQDGDIIAISQSIYSTSKQVLAHTSYSGNKALIDLGAGDNVTLVGIADHLTASDISII